MVSAYPVLVPQLDEDGIPLGGIEDPALAAPLGTYWGWNLRRDGFAGGNLCGLNGTFAAFPKTAEAANGDSRKPLSERYADVGAYLKDLAGKSEELVAAGFLLSDDIPMVVERGRAMYPVQ